MKMAAHITVSDMQIWNIRPLRNLRPTQAKTTVTDEKISTKVLIKPGITGRARSGHG